MSSQSELNQYPNQYILYYCGAIHYDPTVYDNIGLSNVCQIDFDGFGNLKIVNWYVGSYSAPSMLTLMSYTLTDVLEWYNNFYLLPASLASCQLCPLTTNQITALRTDSSMIGYLLFNTTECKYQYFNGSSWTNLL